MSQRFAGKVAIVTGSSSGIGQAIALQIARGGGAVCVVADRNVTGGQATTRQIAEAGGKSLFVQADVSAAADCKRIAAETLAAFGRIDILVNNAGITRGRFLQDTDDALWDTVMNTNLKSAFMLSREVVGDMLLRGWGSVINISSVHAMATYGGRSAYAASKAGLGGLTRSLACEFGGRGIRFNCVAPGSIDVSDYPGPALSPQHIEKWSQQAKTDQVMERLGKADEVAAMVCFLASEEASFVNGATLVVDGGLLTKLGAS